MSGKGLIPFIQARQGNINMTNELQINWAKKSLQLHGRVTRNQALRRHISRLSAIIHTLRKRGMKIKAGWNRSSSGNDYEYTLVKK